MINVAKIMTCRQTASPADRQSSSVADGGRQMQLRQHKLKKVKFERHQQRRQITAKSKRADSNYIKITKTTIVIKRYAAV